MVTKFFEYQKNLLGIVAVSLYRDNEISPEMFVHMFCPNNFGKSNQHKIQ